MLLADLYQQLDAAIAAEEYENAHYIKCDIEAFERLSAGPFSFVLSATNSAMWRCAHSDFSTPHLRMPRNAPVAAAVHQYIQQNTATTHALVPC